MNQMISNLYVLPLLGIVYLLPDVRRHGERHGEGHEDLPKWPLLGPYDICDHRKADAITELAD